MKKSKLLKLPPAGARAAIYSRFSTAKQGEEGLSSCDTQDRINEKACAERGWTVAARFRDEAKTGGNLQRKGWEAALAAAQRGEFDVLVIVRMNRLGRGDEFVIAQYELKKAGVPVFTALESFSDDMGGYVQRGITNVLDGAYIHQIRSFTVDKLVAMIDMGLWVGGGECPFGWQAVEASEYAGVGKRPPKRLRHDPIAAPIVAGAIGVLLETRSQADVRHWLNEATGQEWTLSRTKSLLTCPYHGGRLVWGEVVRDGWCEPIVDPAVWQQAQDILSAPRPRRVRRDRKQSLEPWYLSGRVRCACGAAMSPYWSRGRGDRIYRYYRCQASGRCTVAEASAPRLHEAIVRELTAIAQHPWRLRRALEAAETERPDTGRIERELATTLRQFKAASARYERLLESVALTGDAGLRADLLLRAGQVRTEVDALESLCGSLRQQLDAADRTRPDARALHAIASRVSELWPHATEEERAELFRALVGAVVIDRQYYVVDILVGDPDFEVGPSTGSTRSEIEGHRPRPPLNFSTARSSRMWIPRKGSRDVLVS